MVWGSRGVVEAWRRRGGGYRSESGAKWRGGGSQEQRLHGVGMPGRGGGMAEAWWEVSVGFGREMVGWRIPRTEAP
eukprot:455008-Pyramimonas_sp.AAC.1